LLAMVDNDNACFLVERGAPGSIASELAPTKKRRSSVGASLLAMVDNDNACFLVEHGALGSIAACSLLQLFGGVLQKMYRP